MKKQRDVLWVVEILLDSGKWVASQFCSSRAEARDKAESFRRDYYPARIRKFVPEETR